MKLLCLDPGEVTGFALMELESGVLTIAADCVTPCGILVPAEAGMPGQRRLLRHWLAWMAPRVDEVAIEREIPTGKVRTAIEGTKVREVIDAALETLGVTPSYYGPTSVKAAVKRLSGWEGKGLPSKAVLRDLAKQILGVRWAVGPDHVSDALAIGCTHAATAHGWRWEDVPQRELIPRVGDDFFDILKARRRGEKW